MTKTEFLAKWGGFETGAADADKVHAEFRADLENLLQPIIQQFTRMRCSDCDAYKVCEACGVCLHCMGPHLSDCCMGDLGADQGATKLSADHATSRDSSDTTG